MAKKEKIIQKAVGQNTDPGKELLGGVVLGMHPGMGVGASGAVGALAGAGTISEWWGRDLQRVGGSCRLSAPRKVVSVM